MVHLVHGIGMVILMSMLTPHDISMMEDDVNDIISGWNTKVTILIPLPMDKQVNWNELMREYTGKVLYNKLIDVPVERKDIPNIYSENVKIDNAGTVVHGDVVYAVPVTFNGDNIDMNTDCIFIIDDSEYIVKHIRYRIGEYLVQLSKLTGGTASGGAY